MTKLLTKGRLKELYKEWKDSLTTQSDSADDLLKDFSKNLPMNKDLMKLLGNTFTLDKKEEKKNKDDQPPKKKENTSKPTPFNPKRFPSSFSIDTKSKDKDGTPLTQVPLGGDKTISFSTDVEDQYFDRTDEPGDLKITVLSSSENDVNGKRIHGN